MQVKDRQRKDLNAYAWPGGYPIMYLARDGWRDDNTGKLDFNQYDRYESVCCASCAADIDKWPDLIIVTEYIHYEGPPEYCEWCNGFTDSAYGDPSEDTEPNHDDTVLYCPDCETPNQFGELCSRCQREQESTV